jgi:hypothetical protein
MCHNPLKGQISINEILSFKSKHPSTLRINKSPLFKKFPIAKKKKKKKKGKY